MAQLRFRVPFDLESVRFKAARHLIALEDPLLNRLAFVLLISMEMPQPVIQGALRVLVVVRVMPKPQEVQRLM